MHNIVSLSSEIDIQNIDISETSLFPIIVASANYWTTCAGTTIHTVEKQTLGISDKQIAFERKRQMARFETPPLWKNNFII